MIKRLFQNDWFVASLFLIAYLCTNSYTIGWDDQHLEIPLLKHLIDPNLYKGDYYVEGLAKNFSSFLYPILARVISTDQIPAVYLILFLIARYFMFYWVYRLWLLLSGDRFAAAMAVAMFFLMGRTDEFLYRTFSHQEFSYIFMFAGFYYFYRERFLLAAALLGIGANIHAIYCLFPMLFMMIYIAFFRRDRWWLGLKAGATFTIFALPFLLWQIPHSLAAKGAPVPISEWMPLYLISCQQNFLFWTKPLSEALKDVPFMLGRLEPYLFLLVLYGIFCILEPRLRNDRKTHVLIAVSYVFIFCSFYFSYLHPSRFMIDLNLLRNEQYVRFMLMGYTTLWACRWVTRGNAWQALLAGIVFILVGFGGTTYFDLRLKQYTVTFGLYILVFAGVLWRPQLAVWAGQWATRSKAWPALLAGILFIAVGLGGTAFFTPQQRDNIVRFGLFIFVFAGILWRPQLTWLPKAFIVLPLLTSFVSYARYHYVYVQTKEHGGGMWQMYRNWLDMQNYVRAHTPVNALVMTPYDTEYGGFRIFSERKVLVCYRDCGIIGFDYKKAVEWNQRIKDSDGFVMYSNQPPSQAVINAVLKYKVDYIVFMNYYQPLGSNPVLNKLYQNEVFALYEVKH